MKRPANFLNAAMKVVVVVAALNVGESVQEITGQSNKENGTS